MSTRSKGVLKSLLGAIVLVAFAATSSGCKEAPENQVEGVESMIASVETYEGIGVVKTITPSRNFVNINHETIPGFMDAMSMFFAVHDTTLFNDIHVNDSIRFTIEVKGGDVLLTDATLINP